MSDNTKLDNETKNNLNQNLNEWLRNYFVENIPSELDSLATHICITDILIIEIDENIEENCISFECTGSISCSLQYGSNGDNKRGDGLQSSESFPFSLNGSTELSNLQNINIDEESINIDTSSFSESE